MKRTCVIIGIFFLSAISFFANHANGMVDPDMIRWKTPNEAIFIQSIYNATFGRNPTQDEMNRMLRLTNNSRRSKFLSLIGSSEYRKRFGHLEKEWFVYYRIMWYRDLSASCRCYHVAKFSADGFHASFCALPISNFPVAIALMHFCADFDEEACPGPCGGSPPNPRSLLPWRPQRNRSHNNSQSQHPPSEEVRFVNMISGTWEFGRANTHQVLAHLNLTKRIGKYGYIIGGSHHPNESYWRPIGNNMIVFYHAKGYETTIFKRVGRNLFKGRFIPPPGWNGGKGTIHYLKR